MKAILAFLLLLILALPVMADEYEPVMVASSLMLMGAGAGEPGSGTPSQTGAYLLKEDNGALLLETGEHLLLEE